MENTKNITTVLLRRKEALPTLINTTHYTPSENFVPSRLCGEKTELLH